MNRNMKRLSLVVFCLLLVAGVVIFGERTALAGGPPDELYLACVDPDDRAAIRTERNTCDDVATGEGYNVGIFRPCTPAELEAGSGSLCDEQTIGCIDPGADRYLCLGAPANPCADEPNGTACQGTGECCNGSCIDPETQACIE